jgi:hypothetical protein
LQALWAEYSKEKLDICTFLSSTRDILPLVMNAAHLATIEAAEGVWEMHHKELEALVVESGIGEKLFCGAVDAWKSERVQTCVTDLLSKMPAALSEVEVKKLFSTLATVTGSMDKSLFARTRVISLVFKGLLLEIEAGSISDELNLRVHAWIKERMPADLLPALPFENELPKSVGLLVLGVTYVSQVNVFPDNKITLAVFGLSSSTHYSNNNY